MNLILRDRWRLCEVVGNVMENRTDEVLASFPDPSFHKWYCQDTGYKSILIICSYSFHNVSGVSALLVAYLANGACYWDWSYGCLDLHSVSC